jgi:cytochrome c biogenesis protein CcmG/thiol:disulfide interchange protein DsbE
MNRFILPFVIFLALSVFLYKGLGRDTSDVPSPLVNKAAPVFTLPLLSDAKQKFNSGDMKGKVWLLNVWASWCGACKDEHPMLMALSKQNILPIVGMDYKDTTEAGEATLNKAGDPYTLTIADADGKVGFDFGVYGVPETYLIDKQGIIRFKLTGAVNPENWQSTLLPKIKELQAK